MKFGTLKYIDVVWISAVDDSLLEKYRKYGPKIVDMIEGEFSFVLYEKDKDIYFAARDPLGIKALYYAKNNDKYYFSPDVSDLLKLAALDKKPNLKSMRTMLECQAVDHSETMYEGIYRLPPGCTLTINKGRESIVRYWHPEKIETNYRISEEEASQRLKVIFGKAIQKQIDKLEETAFQLSGGLDSSSVVSVLTQKEDSSLISCYTLGFEGVDCDESEYVNAILQDYDFKHKTIAISDLDYKGKYSLEYLYKLSPNWPITTTFAMSIPMVEKMREDGKKIVLTGQGGDHLFAGTPYMMSDLFRRGRFIALYRELKHYKRPLRIWRDYALRPVLNPKFVEILRRFLGKKPAERTREQLCSKMDADFVSDISNPAKKFDLDMITTALYTTLMDGNLFHCMEKHFDIEYRHPFFDRELVEFVLSLPPEFKYRQRKIKWIWRKAMEGILPDKVRERGDKAEFSEVLMRQIDAVDLDVLLGDPCIVKLGLIERSVLDTYIESYRERSKKHTVALWTAINVEYWYGYNGFGCK